MKRQKDYLTGIKRLGRTSLKDGVLYFNWTCSGFTFAFEGTCADAEFVAASYVEIEGMITDETAPRRTIWPIIAVFLDGENIPYKEIPLTQERMRVNLFSSEEKERHRITVRKVTENQKGKTGLADLELAGSILPEAVEDKKRLRMEFIGDSITCGYGNRVTDGSRFFFSEEEKGYLSHAVLAANELDAEYSLVSWSGITVGEGLGKILWPGNPMKALYPYTDRPLEEALGKNGDFEDWDFENNRQDIVVLNLGTNDGTRIALEEDYLIGTAKFKEDYSAFIRTLRKVNGENTWIICALGSMDYFLFPEIQECVRQYQKETGDTRISSFRYGKMGIQEGVGADGHPTIRTHERMAKELAAYIRTECGRYLSDF